MASVGDFRPEHAVFAVIVATLAYTGPRTKAFLLEISPLLLVALGYDAFRYARQALVTSDRVLGCGLARADHVLFPAGGGHSIQQWLASQPSPARDLFFALPYALFAYIALAYAARLYFKDRSRLRQFAWAFAIANYISFAMWLMVPAAPPWYVNQHGCAIDLSVAPDPAGLARVDALLGVPYFHELYARASSVFGALPSMHNAYPLLGLLVAWPGAGWRARVLHLGYLAWMFVASLYLDHHWLLDALAGWLVAVTAVLAARRCLGLSAQGSPARPVGARSSGLAV